MADAVVSDKIIEINLDRTLCTPKNKNVIELVTGGASKRIKKAKLTNLTYATLNGNRNSGKIDKISEILNAKLVKMRNEIVQEETIKAEKEYGVNEKAVLTGVVEQKETTTSYRDKVTGIFEKINTELTDFYENYVTNGSLKAKLAKDSKTKALIVKSKLIASCKQARLPLETSGGNEGKKVIQSLNAVTWRSLALFDTTPLPEEEEISSQVCTGVVQAPIQRGITKEQLKDRKLIAQLGDDIDQVDRLLTGIGKNTPFNSGLRDRRNAVVKMLSEYTSIPLKYEEGNTDDICEVTEFQAFINSITGYKKPASKQEHEKIQEEYDKYYSDPEVQERMDDLRHKNILFDMNQPEVYESISRAERIANERNALETMNESIKNATSVNDVENEKFLSGLQEAALAQAKELLALAENKEEEEEILRSALEEAKRILNNNYMESLREGAMEQAKLLLSEARDEEEKRELISGAYDQAREILDKRFLEEIKESSLEEAKKLIASAKDEEEKERLIKGALEQARLLKEASDVERIKVAAREQANILFARAKNEEEQNALVAGALEQARMLLDEEERANIVESAKEEAMRLLNATKNEEEKEAILAGALEQAKLLQQEAINARIKEVAEKEVSELFAKAKEEKEQQRLLVGALEQAKLIQEQNEREELKTEAVEQAKALFEYARNEEEKEQLLAGALEQAKLIEDQIEREIINKSAMEEALIIFRNAQNEEDKVNLLAGALEQANLLIEAEERANLINGAKTQAKMLFDARVKEELAKSGREQAELIMDEVINQEIKESSLYEAYRMLGNEEREEQIEHEEIVNGAKETAQAIVDKELLEEIKESSLYEAYRMLGNEERALQEKEEEEAKEKEELVKAGKEQAEIIYDAAVLEEIKESSLFEAYRLLNIEDETSTEVKSEVKTYDGFELFDGYSRYASLAAKSKPIRLGAERVSNVRKHTVLDENTHNIRGVLNSIKDQLAALGLGNADDEPDYGEVPGATA